MTNSEDLERHTPQDAAYRDKTSPVWDMSQERMFMENLLNQRFNFFLVAFAFVLAAAVNSKVQLHLQLILTLGAAISFLFALVLWRSQRKLDLILKDLFTDPSHPASIINDRAGTGSRRHLIGFVIPPLCCATLTVGAALAWCCVFTVPPVAR